MSTINRNDGFALPVAVFALVVMGVLVTGGFFMSQQESRMGTATENTALALYVAEKGLHDVMINDAGNLVMNLSIGGNQALGGTTEQGTWTVRVDRMSQTTFFLAGQAGVTEGGALYSGAARSLGVLTKVVTPNLDPPAALTMKGGFTASGAPNKVDGADQDPWAGAYCSAPGPDKTGVLTNDSSAIETSGGGGASCPPQITGNPCIEEDEPEVNSQFQSIDDQWTDLIALANHSLTSLSNPSPTLTGTGDCDASDPTNMGSPQNPTGPCGDYFPMIYVNGDVSFTGSSQGQGILLVDGDLSMSGTPDFRGIIVVRGEFTASSGTPDIHGGVLAESVGDLNGTPNMNYSSCAVQRAIYGNSNITRFVPLANRSWVDLTALSN